MSRKYLQTFVVFFVSITAVDSNASLNAASQLRMAHERWATSQGPFWNEQKWLSGDFNGDGRDDMVKVFQERSKVCIDVHLAGNGDFAPHRWVTGQGRFWDEQQWRVGDFNGDGKDDLVNVFDERGKISMEVYLAGNGSFAPQRWATGQGRFWAGQQWQVGDFNGDGKDDVAKAFEENGKACVDVHLAGNGDFNPQRWVTGPGRFWDEQQWWAGDFNGDGKDDIAKIFQERGKTCIDVYLAGNGSFAPQRWATEQGRFWDEQRWRSGDFNGDGRDDIAKAFEENGKICIEVHLSRNGEFTPQRWMLSQTRFWTEQQWRAGDFNGDGKDDMANAFEERNKANIDVYLSTH